MTEQELQTQQAPAGQVANPYSGPNNGSIIVNNPMAKPEPTASEQFDAAVATKDPKATLAVAQRHAGTDVGFAALKASDVMLKGQREFKDMTAPIDKAGGLGTPEGNIAAAKQGQKYFQQDEPRFRDAFVHWLTGNNAMAQAMLTGGSVTKNIVTDINGKLIKVSKNQLGDIVDVEDSLGNKLTQEEYDKRYVGRQKYEDTLGYLNQKQQQEENIKKLKISQEVNNANASFQAQAGSKYGEIFDNIGILRKNGVDFSAKEYADLLKFSSNSLGTADSLSKGKTTLDQAQKDINVKKGETLTKDELAALGIGGKDALLGWKWTERGIRSEEAGKTKTFGELKQEQTSENRNNELTRNYQQTKNDLFASEKFKKLGKEDQNRMLAVLENSYQLSKKEAEISSTIGTPTFLVLPSSISIEDQGAAAQIKSIQGMFNSKAMQLYGEYEKKMMRESGGIAPNPKELEAGFTRTEEYKKLLETAKQLSDNVLKEPKTNRQTETPRATEGAAPPKTTATENKPSGSRQPPESNLPKGIPRGSVKSGRVTPKGETLWKAPDGSLHTED
jgi:hypothetical protein